MLKRKIFSAIIVAGSVCALAISPIVASAYTKYDTGNVFTKYWIYSGTYCRINAQPNYTMNTAVDDGYIGSFKQAGYQDYTYSTSDGYELREVAWEADWTETIMTDYVSHNNSVARRRQTANIYYTSSTNSGIKESHLYVLTKN